MSNYKTLYNHEQEEDIAIFCAKNNVEFNETNAYDIVLETFKDHPIKKKYKDEDTGEEKERNNNYRIARQIEFQPKTIERIAAKAEVYKKRFAEETYAKNIEQAKKDSKPNLQMLVDNLYRLNIVDGHSYLAVVNNLMQIKYSRDGEIPEDDKTCMFFNGVAHNGKSATAKAICEVEAQYGKVFRAQSGKLLSSTHEEQVWQSHLNYFDEVKPTDIDRELLLTIVNGDDVEINPKNKKHYNYHVNTNNIFTSNDQINLMQRRLSIIKFGNRLNGRPLGAGTLKEVITNIMNSLPDFSRYYDMYNIVSVYNENRINPLAMGDFTAFLDSKFSRVTETDEYTLTAEFIFAPHEIDRCIQNKYNKQIISSERKDALKVLLKYLSEKGLIQEVHYNKCTTKYYKVTGADYLNIINEFRIINTKDEKNVKITKNELYDLLAPFFDVKTAPENPDSDNTEQNVSPESEMVNNHEPDITAEVEKTTKLDAGDLNCTTTSLVNFVDEATYRNITGPSENQILVTADTEAKGTILFHQLLKQIKRLIDHAGVNDIPFDLGLTVEDALKECITPEICQCISYKGLLQVLKENVNDFDDSYDNFVKELYMRLLGMTDENTLEAFEKYKLSYLPEGRSDGVTIESRAYFEACKKLEKQKEKKAQAALVRKDQLQRKKEHLAEIERIKQEEREKQVQSSEIKE